MTFCITPRRGTSKLLELIPKSYDDINKIYSKQLTTNCLIGQRHNISFYCRPLMQNILCLSNDN